MYADVETTYSTEDFSVLFLMDDENDFCILNLSVCSESSKVLRGSLECENAREDVLVTVTERVSVMGTTMM